MTLRAIVRSASAILSTTFVVVSGIAILVIAHDFSRIESVRVIWRTRELRAHALPVSTCFQVFFPAASHVFAFDIRSVELLDPSRRGFEAAACCNSRTASVPIVVDASPPLAIYVLEAVPMDVVCGAMVGAAPASLCATDVVIRVGAICVLAKQLRCIDAVEEIGRASECWAMARWSATRLIVEVAASCVQTTDALSIRFLQMTNWADMAVAHGNLLATTTCVTCFL